QPRLEREDLVDLLLVFGHHDRYLGMVEHIGQFAGDRVLIDRHRNAAEAHRGELREIEARPVLADYRQLGAAPEARGGEAKREIAHLLPIAPPAIGLPDAAGL